MRASQSRNRINNNINNTSLFATIPYKHRFLFTLLFSFSPTLIKMKANFLLFSAITMIISGIATAFAPMIKQSSGPSLNTNTLGRFQGHAFISSNLPVPVQKQRNSVGNTQTLGLFGLGGPEIAIILVAAAFLLGPQKLAELGRDAGKIAGELKEVPKEFQKGLAEGEIQAKSLKNELLESSGNNKEN